jgi:hypothetical protein
MDAPELGVLQYPFKTTEWLGPRNNKREKTAYGIWDVIAGYDHAPEGEEEDDAETGDMVVGSGVASVLEPLDPWDEDKYGPLVGFKAHDLGIIKKNRKVGKNDNALCMDDTIDGGPIRVRSMDQSIEIDEAKYGQGCPLGVRDLLVDPQWYPGWDSKGEHLSDTAYSFSQTWEGAGRQTAGVDLSPPAEEGDMTPEETIVVPTEEPTTEPTTEESPKSASDTSGGDEHEMVGKRVKWKNSGTEYLGTCKEVYGDVGAELCKVTVVAEEQPSEAAKQDVTDLLKAFEHADKVPLKSLKVL